MIGDVLKDLFTRSAESQLEVCFGNGVIPGVGVSFSSDVNKGVSPGVGVSVQDVTPGVSKGVSPGVGVSKGVTPGV